MSSQSAAHIPACIERIYSYQYLSILLITFAILFAYKPTFAADTMTPDINNIILEHGTGEIKHAIIWLHGLGASANDFPPIVPELGLQEDRAIRFVFAQAPDRAITINGGMRMPAWYDIKGLDLAGKQDEKGISESKAQLDALIEEQIAAGIASHNIIIAGFSQGGAVAYHTALRSPHKLAGILAMSTYLPFADNVESERSKVNLAIPILSQHGSADPVVPLQMGKDSADKLSELGYPITWQTYPMEHQVVIQQIQTIGTWINTLFSR